MGVCQVIYRLEKSFGEVLKKSDGEGLLRRRGPMEKSFKEVRPLEKSFEEGQVLWGNPLEKSILDFFWRCSFKSCGEVL